MNDKQIFGIDWSNGKDWSCLMSYCSKCGRVLEAVSFQENKITPTLYRVCPNCGVQFKGYMIGSE